MGESMDDNPSVNPAVSAGMRCPEWCEDRTGNAGMMGPRRPGKRIKTGRKIGLDKDGTAGSGNPPPGCPGYIGRTKIPKKRL
jgi:hypothetical protein